MRNVTRYYLDPLDAIWLRVAERAGFSVERSAEVYATTNGVDTITIGTPETLDADDCLAQMILHELCHALVQGPAGDGQPDWGLDNETDRDLVREHACLRLQAALTTQHGLREPLAPTTEHRAYYDQLPSDPLQGPGADAALAQRASIRLATLPWHDALRAALSATAKIMRCAADLHAADPQRPQQPLWFVLAPPH